MASLESIKKKENELKTQKYFIQVNNHFNFCLENFEHDQVISKFLNSRNGVDLNYIDWFIKNKVDDYPLEVKDLKIIFTLYKIKRDLWLPLSFANKCVEKLKPFGFYINAEDAYDISCVICNKTDILKSLSLLEYQGSGYESHSDHYTRSIIPQYLFQYRLHINRNAFDNDLRNISINIDNIEDVYQKLKEIKKVIDNNSFVKPQFINRHRWICTTCFNNPDIDKIIIKLKLRYFNSNWIEVRRIEFKQDKQFYLKK